MTRKRYYSRPENQNDSVNLTGVKISQFIAYYFASDRLKIANTLAAFNSIELAAVRLAVEEIFDLLDDEYERRKPKVKAVAKEINITPSNIRLK